MRARKESGVKAESADAGAGSEVHFGALALKRQ